MIRTAPATLDHAPGIAGVHVRSWQAAYAGVLDPAYLEHLSIEQRTARWRGILEKGDSHTLVALDSETILGIVNFGHCRDSGAEAEQGEIWALYVEPGVWGQGLGRTLLRHAIQALQLAGTTSTSLWVLSGNDRGLRFYRGSGFERVAGSEQLFELGGRQIEEVRLLLQHGA